MAAMMYEEEAAAANDALRATVRTLEADMAAMMYEDEAAAIAAAAVLEADLQAASIANANAGAATAARKMEVGRRRLTPSWPWVDPKLALG